MSHQVIKKPIRPSKKHIRPSKELSVTLAKASYMPLTVRSKDSCSFLTDQGVLIHERHAFLLCLGYHM